MSGRIFLSYRRADASHATGRIYDRLCDKFNEKDIFFDIDAIPLGTDFVEKIEESVSACDLMLVVIGPDWLDAKDAEGKRRLDDPQDYVRLEILAALKRDIPIIPVFVEQAQSPREVELPDDLRALARRNGARISHVGFTADTEKLVRGIEAQLNAINRARLARELDKRRDELLAHGGAQPDKSVRDNFLDDATAPGQAKNRGESEGGVETTPQPGAVAPPATNKTREEIDDWVAPVRHLLPVAIKVAATSAAAGFVATHATTYAFAAIRGLQPYEALATSLVALVIALCWGLIGAIISTLAGPSRGTLHSAAAGWAAQLLLVAVIFVLFDRGELLQGLLHFGILLGPVGALIGAITWSIWSQDQHNGLLS